MVRIVMLQSARKSVQLHRPFSCTRLSAADCRHTLRAAALMARHAAREMQTDSCRAPGSIRSG